MAGSTPPATASPAELVAWSFGCLNDHDVEPLRRVWTASTVERFPDRTLRGSDEIAAYFRDLFTAVPDMRIEIVKLVEDGEDVFVRWRMTGTHTGAPYAGIEATGRRVELDGVDHFVVRDGTVESNFVIFDQMQFARAIGLMPPDGSPADKALKAAFNARTRVAAKVRERVSARR